MQWYCKAGWKQTSSLKIRLKPPRGSSTFWNKTLGTRNFSLLFLIGEKSGFLSSHPVPLERVCPHTWVKSNLPIGTLWVLSIWDGSRGLAFSPQRWFCLQSCACPTCPKPSHIATIPAQFLRAKKKGSGKATQLLVAQNWYLYSSIIHFYTL